MFVLCACPASAQVGTPELPLRVVPNWLQLPPAWNFRETPGIAVDARGHVYVVHRGEHPIMEFDAIGKFVRAFGDGLFDRAHSVRIDPQGNLWGVDDGSHVVFKMDTEGHVRMVLGRYRKSGDSVPPPQPGPRGLRDENILLFNRPTDVAFAPNGDIYVTDGYGNSRVVKFTSAGLFVKAWGPRGTAKVSSIRRTQSQSTGRAACMWPIARTTAFRSSPRRAIFAGVDECRRALGPVPHSGADPVHGRWL